MNYLANEMTKVLNWNVETHFRKNHGGVLHVADLFDVSSKVSLLGLYGI